MRANRRIAAGCAILVASLLGFSAIAAGQVKVEVTIPATPPAKVEIPQYLRQKPPKATLRAEGSAGSLRLRTDRQATERLAAARTQFQQGHLAEALRLLGQLPAESFVVVGDQIVAGPWAAEQLRRELKPAQRAIYEATAGPAALPAWQRFLMTQAGDELLAFCRDYGDTQAGLLAWQTLAGRHRDQGQWSLAAAAWQHVLRHPLANGPQRAIAVLGQMEAAGRSGHEADARTLLNTHRELLQTTSVPIAGSEVIGAVFAAQFLPDAARDGESALIAQQPALTPRWTVPLRPPRDLGPHLDQWFGELRDHGVWLLPAAMPVVTDHVVLIRSHQLLLALNRANGEQVWQVPFDDWPWIEKNPGILDNAGYRTTLLEQMGRRLLADTVMNRPTTDRERVYVVQESGLSQGSPANFGAPASRSSDGPANSGERFNHLAAFRLDTGELAWKIGGASAGPAYPLGGEFFCGPPTVVDNVLFVPGQQQTELQLLAVDARRGELLWKTTLGDLPRPLASDPARQRIACPVVWQNGVLLCPTAAGVLIAVDPLTHAPRWAYRYGVTLRESAYRQRNENTAFLPDLWWDAWREVTLKYVGDVAVLVSPESDRLHALNLDTGQVRWTMPREDGLLLLEVAGDTVLVAEPTAIRAHDLATGRVLWRTPIGEIAGRAVVTESHVVVPTGNGSLQRLRLSDGVKEPGVGTADSSVGNLVQHQGEWYSVSTAAVAAWTDLVIARPVAEAALRDEPRHGETILSAARLALEAGEASVAWERLKSDHSAAARALKKLAVQEILLREPARWTEFRDIGEIGSFSAVERVDLALQLSAAAAHAGDVAAAADLLLEALSDAPINGEVLFANPRRRVRPDLALSGALVALLRQADEPQRRTVEEQLAAAWNRAATGTDPFATQRLSERWSGLEFARRQLSTSGEPAFLGLPLLAVELRLLEASGSTDPAVQTAALNELLRQLSQNGFHHEADDYRRAMLRGDYGSHAVAEVSLLRSPTTPWEAPWPTVPPQPDSQRERNEDVYQFPVPLDLDTSPLFDRMDVLMERQGRSVRFSGGGVSGVWTVALPASNSSYRYLQHHTLGWGRGGLLILRVGFELFALAPFNDRGEPQAKVLWTANTAGDPPPPPDSLRLDVVPAVTGIREDEYRVIDRYSRTVGQVGPVRANFLCYAEKSKLVCIETLTGRKRWERYDLPAGFLLGGDDDAIFVWQPQTGELVWLQASDGRTISKQTWNASPDDVVLQSGRWFWHRDGTKLVCEDRLAGTTLWTRDLAANETAFAMSGRTLGVVRAGGMLTLLSALTGQPQSEPIALNGPAEIDRVVVSRDDERWYVALSERVPQQAGLQQAQLRSGFRSPFIIGPLAAIDRDQPRLLWQTHLDREPWSADQPRAAPLLMQVFKLPSPDLQSGRQSDGVVQLRDKRDGGIVFRKQHAELVGYATLAADPDRAVVDLQLERETVRLRYRPLPPPPALPDR